jgi:GR25 family glycosyltransferase involved in LPS biosynthesis
MYNRTKGAIGCYESQMEVMRIALSKNKHALVLEDDCVFCEDFNERLKIISDHLADMHWDILWLGATYHTEPTWHKIGHPQLPLCNCKYYKDYEPALENVLVRTYGCWSTYAYIVNVNSIDRVLHELEKWIPQSIGIDYSMILMQPNLYTYSPIYGMVKQYDNQSDIGAKITKFSKFENLGEHWYKDKL